MSHLTIFWNFNLSNNSFEIATIADGFSITQLAIQGEIIVYLLFIITKIIYIIL